MYDMSQWTSGIANISVYLRNCHMCITIIKTNGILLYQIMIIVGNYDYLSQVPLRCLLYISAHERRSRISCKELYQSMYIFNELPHTTTTNKGHFHIRYICLDFSASISIYYTAL